MMNSLDLRHALIAFLCALYAHVALGASPPKPLTGNTIWAEDSIPAMQKGIAQMYKANLQLWKQQNSFNAITCQGPGEYNEGTSCPLANEVGLKPNHDHS